MISSAGRDTHGGGEGGHHPPVLPLDPSLLSRLFQASIVIFSNEAHNVSTAL